MRTVSFSNPRVQRLLDNHFVCTFTNTLGDPTSGLSIKHAPNEPAGNCIRGNGKQNVQTIFMTPQGEIFHVATGFLSPDDLAAEIQFAGDLFGDIAKNPRPAAQVVVEAHRSRLSELGFTEADIEGRNPMEAFLAMPAFSSQGSGPRGSFEMPNPFEAMIRGQFLSDQKFVIHNPLMPWKTLQNDPAKLVGNGRSFFSSSSSSGGQR